MGLGSGIALLAAGAVAAFAVRDSIDGVDLTMLGYILMAAGAALTVLTLVTANSRRHSSSVTRTTGTDGSQATREVRSETSPPPLA